MLINASFNKGIFPDALKIAKVVPIFKSDDKSVLSNYRSVSVLSVISKMFERLMYKRLNTYFINNNLLSDSQFGFEENILLIWQFYGL